MQRTSFFSGLKVAIKAAGIVIVGGLFSAPAMASPLSVPLAGDYRIQQKSNGRYMDAHQGVNDSSVVTRNAQNNNTQVWTFTHVGGQYYRIQQKSSGGYLDAHTNNGADYSVVTRSYQNNDSQIWRLFQHDNGTFRIQQKYQGRLMDAHEGSNDNSVVTRDFQNNATQRWAVTSTTIAAPLPPAPQPIVSLSGEFTVQQKYNMRYMDAYVGQNNNTAATRTASNNAAQVWVIQSLGNGVHTLRQKYSAMNLDAYAGSNDNDAVTRDATGSQAQQWIIKKIGNNLYTVQQRSSGKFLDAYVDGQNDHLIVTRSAQNNSTQRWVIRPSN